MNTDERIVRWLQEEEGEETENACELLDAALVEIRELRRVLKIYQSGKGTPA